MENNFQYLVEQFADLRILRFNIPNFEKLPLPQKKYIYYLSQAALSGRDILWDQNNKYNLWLRHVLTAIYTANSKIEDQGEAFKLFEVFFKRVLFSNGFHHHYSTDKLEVNFSKEQLQSLVAHLTEGQINGLRGGSKEELFEKLLCLLYDASFASKRVCQDPTKDLLVESANNFYEGVTQKEAESYYQKKYRESGHQSISHGLNSRLVKEGDTLKEEVWKSGGVYGMAIDQIIYWLEKAGKVAENKDQETYIKLLCDYYRTGDLHLFDEYSIKWIHEQSGDVDFINGFIEVYGDSLSYKATWESLVNIKDREASEHVKVISDNAQWFEDRSPVDVGFRKKQVSGVSMKVISAVMLGGDCYPASPLGINLPNAEWIREVHGSKSVSLENISYAHGQASLKAGVLEEFAANEEQIELHKKFGSIADNLHTHLHECLGHGSGRMLEGIKIDDLKAYGSTIEEARADLFGLYFMADEKMLELDLVPDMDVYKAQYNSYLRNGLMVQTARIQLGKDIEQAHMRNRQMISKWVLEKGQKNKVVELTQIEGKKYIVIHDYEQLRALFGELLKEIQRIKSTGDYQAAKDMIETYGVKIDQDLHQEVLERYKKLNVAPYTGFLNPVLEPELNDTAEIVDVKISYKESFLEQMLRYGREYSFIDNFERM